MSKIITYIRPVTTLCIAFFIFAFCVSGQDTVTAGNFRVGEKLSYSVSFNKLSDIAYAEFNVVSSGRIGNADAIEIRSRFRTRDVAVGMLFLIDENRTTFASPVSGLPIFSRKTDRSTGLPRESVSDHIATPTSEHDLNTLIYALRNGGASGILSFSENGRSYTLSYQHGKTETVTTDAGSFETNIVTVTSDYLTELGISNLKVNLSANEAKIPVLWRFNINKGQYRVALSAVSVGSAATGVVTTPTATPLPTPMPTATPKPLPTPTPYIPNQPLSNELAFVLGENLEYRISDGGRELGSLILRAESRQMVDNRDTLKLSARIVNVVDQAMLGSGGEMIAYVDPLTLGPRRVESKFTGSLASLNHLAIFDDRTNSISFGAAKRIDAPVGTHSILSLLYAARSFNLKPSQSAGNPINDTRVAVFWDEKANVFILRPTAAEIVNLRGEKLSGQQISISTGNPQFDILAPKIWLGNDDRRLPLRITIGNYRIELVSHSVIAP